MSKFNSTTTKAATFSPVTATGPAVNHEGAVGHARDAKSELFLLAVANMVRQDTFYERAGERDDRYGALIRQVAVDDVEWTFQFLRWLRADGNMRSASLVGAVEMVKARLAAKVPSVPAYEMPGLKDDRGIERATVDAILQRADEPGELLAYWTSTYGKAIPKPVKRGVADAVQRLYTEYALLKYDTESKGFRFADVLDLVHPTPSAPWQGDLFRVALDRRHKREFELPDSLSMLWVNQMVRAQFNADPNVVLDAEKIRKAGLTWEDVLSLAGSKVDKAALWTALIPTMGYMALLRNLRNFDQAGVTDEVAEQVTKRLADAEQVAKSRQFPFRFYAAYKAVGGLRWAYPLEKALNASLANVPTLPGRTLVLVDQSPSMWPGYGFQMVRSDMVNADLAKLFGTAVALRAEAADLVQYGGTSTAVPFRKGDAVLRVMERFQQINATDTFGAVARHFSGHDRVVIVTDEQNQAYGHRSLDHVLPAHVPAYVWNIGGYAVGSTAATRANRHTFAGMTDHAFKMIPLLERGTDAAWPWEAKP